MDQILYIYIISYLVDDRDQKPNYFIEVLLNLSNQPEINGIEIINNKNG